MSQLTAVFLVAGWIEALRDRGPFGFWFNCHAYWVRSSAEVDLSFSSSFLSLERFSVDVNRNSKGVPKGAQIRFGLL
jgi:hypothetical protein